MRTWLAAILTAMLLLQGAAAVAEAADTATAAADGTAVLTASDIAKLGRPASDTRAPIREALRLTKDYGLAPAESDAFDQVPAVALERSIAGPLAIVGSIEPSYTSVGIGFRCAR